ncbi:MAG: zinc ribbon domain-containing protein [Planctomycetes bacterium]|nr:zinc ribbon domain-containing protein [Planctomycetota bacterium]
MPIHEFHCPDCDHVFEELVRESSSKTAIVCPTCGGKKVSRQFSVFAARSGSATKEKAPVGGCGRCGDPQGPCSL